MPLTVLPVRKLPTGDNGRLLVRLNIKYRSEINRYGIAKITNNEQKSLSKTVLVLGHDDDEAIFMPYDIRAALKVNKGEKLNFSIEKVGIWEKISWYVSSPDPAVYIPAWIAIIGIGLAIISTVIGAVSLF